MGQIIPHGQGITPSSKVRRKLYKRPFAGVKTVPISSHAFENYLKKQPSLKTEDIQGSFYYFGMQSKKCMKFKSELSHFVSGKDFDNHIVLNFILH